MLLFALVLVNWLAICAIFFIIFTQAWLTCLFLKWMGFHLCRHLLIAFGGLAGLEESIEEDKALKVYMFLLMKTIFSIGKVESLGQLSFHGNCYFFFQSLVLISCFMVYMCFWAMWLFSFQCQLSEPLWAISFLLNYELPIYGHIFIISSE